MSTYAYIPQPLADRDVVFEASRSATQRLADKLGLHVDREFVEAPGDVYVDWRNSKFGLVRLEDRPVGRELLVALQPGDAVVVDNPMLEPKQLTVLISELADRGVDLHVAHLELHGLPGGPPLVEALSLLFALDRRFISRRTQDSMFAAKVKGRPCGGRPAPGWKHVGPSERRRREPNVAEREVMLEIVKLRIKGWGFRRIATFLAKERIMYQVPDPKRRLGFRMEFWSTHRCERAYEEMLRILAEERAEETDGSLAGSV